MRSAWKNGKHTWVYFWKINSWQKKTEKNKCVCIWIKCPISLLKFLVIIVDREWIIRRPWWLKGWVLVAHTFKTETETLHEFWGQPVPGQPDLHGETNSQNKTKKKQKQTQTKEGLNEHERASKWEISIKSHPCQSSGNPAETVRVRGHKAPLHI